MKLGIDVLLQTPDDLNALRQKRVALLATPASMTKGFLHTVDALHQHRIKLSALFGPQHGMRGEKQDNMMESDDYIDPIYHIPVFSLYGKHRRPTLSMLDTFDILLVDIQDLGTRVYTFLTTVLYLLQDCAQTKKSVWILDRPNPAGRPVEGSLLNINQWTSFVGIAPFPMRHGLTIGEAAQWFIHHSSLSLDLTIIPMEGYNPHEGPGFGWPQYELPWVNPSPNAATLNMARCYPGTVLLEGTHLSEGRGTTRPLEMMGAPHINPIALLNAMQTLAPHWMQGCKLRPCYFQPTFQKHTDQMCAGFQIHVDDEAYQPHVFKPYRLIALALKAIRALYPNEPIWRHFHYEYEQERLAIDIINGGPILREWVDDPDASPSDLERLLTEDETHFIHSRKAWLLYPDG